jgi:carbonic anhydrase
MVDNWLRHIVDVIRLHDDELAQLPPEEKLRRLCELNVQEQVKNICDSHTVRNAWRQGAELYVHGWIYSLENGVLKDMLTRRGNAEIAT